MAVAPRDLLPDDALVCRGGSCTAARFRQGSGVTLDVTGRLLSVSVNSAAMTSINLLSAAIPNRQIGVSTVGSIRGAGGSVTPAPSGNNRFHCVLAGITPHEAAALFSPLAANPNR